MTLGIVKINSCVTSKIPIFKKKLPCDNVTGPPGALSFDVKPEIAQKSH